MVEHKKFSETQFDSVLNWIFTIEIVAIPVLITLKLLGHQSFPYSVIIDIVWMIFTVFVYYIYDNMFKEKQQATK